MFILMFIYNFWPRFYIVVLFPFSILTFISLFYSDFLTFFRLLPIISFLYKYFSKNSTRYLCYKWVCHWKSIAQKNINIFCISGLQRKFRTICHTKLRLSEDMEDWHAIHLDSYAAYGSSCMVMPSNILVAEPHQ